MGFSRQEYWSGLPFPSPMHESEKWKWSRSVVSDSSRPHGLQPTKLLHPWDFPGESTGVGCHCLLHIKHWSFATIFPQSVGCVFVLFMISFVVQKPVSLIRFHLFTFAFISTALGDWPKKTLVQFMSENVLPMISSIGLDFLMKYSFFCVQSFHKFLLNW